MTYLVLARKYRPRSFAQVAGQELLTRTLQGAIQEGRVGHAYLFTGPRGTGKTTSARIFAKALNCERGPAADPCGACERCLAVDAGNDVDVVEIDAASNTGVENIRDLREQAAYTPMRARFKIFIVDEVHMLSKGAFNALLKTLEEPPPHVKFLFATTELNKVPDTIVSRCQVLRLSLFREDEIAARLASILSQEAVEPGAGVVEGLARLARGSMRDALSITDQLLALVGNRPVAADVERMAGAGAAGHVQLLMDALIAQDGPRALEVLGPGDGGEAEWIQGLLRELRGALLVSVCREDSALTGDFAQDRERLAKLGAALGPERLQLWMEELLCARERIESAPSLARTVLELALLELCRGERTVPLSALIERLTALELRLQAPGRTPAEPAPAPQPASAAASKPSTVATAPAIERQVLRPPSPSAPLAVAARSATPAAAPAVPAASAPAATSAGHAARAVGGAVGLKPTWDAVVAKLGTTDADLGALLARRGQLIDLNGGRAHVQLRQLRPEERARLGEPEVRERCAAAFQAVLGGAVALQFDDAQMRPPGDKDAFTKSVAELFGGNIEDRT